MIKAAVAAGSAAAGGHALLAGVVPTPAVARLVLAGAFDGGVVISTSRYPLCSRVARGSYHLGPAFDGGGERVLTVDASGHPLDGDQIIDGDGMRIGLLLAQAYV